MAQELSHEKMLEIIVKALDDKKAEDIRVIKVRDLTIIADYFVIAGASSNTQTRALADEVEYQLKEQAQTAPAQVQGNNGSNWIILDYHDVIVHVFHNEQREFYSLERLWSDGEEIDISKWTK
ncbi:MAG: ribosome silencing factor [Oscillospiraceae bacterium]|nr:ribosome silencing factor [Oscillospiraceae bacterium]